jgi:FkbM family methyltransferase
MKLREIVGRTYARVLARSGSAQAVNHALFHLALRGMGYNNGWQLERSGELWFIRNVLVKSDCKVAFDVGANLGEYSKALLKYTPMRVYAFEPLPLACRVLEYIESPRFVAFNIALGRRSDRLALHYGDELTEHATLSPAAQRIGYVGEGNTRTQLVEVEPLDKIVGSSGIQPPDFLKINVEGFEYDVLLGAMDLLANNPPRFIQIEWNLHQLMTGHTLLDFLDLLGEDHYTVWQLLPRGMRRVDPKKPEANIFCYGNFVFVRN